MTDTATDGPTEARRSDWAEVQARLLDAACDAFREGGPTAVTMSAIATRAGVNRTTVHRHYATRDALLWAVSDRLVREMGVDLDGSLGTDTLPGAVDAIHEHFVGNPALARRTLRGLLGAPPTAHALAQLDREVAMMRLLAAGPLGRDGIDAEVLGVINLAGMLLWSALNDAGVVEGGVERYRSEVLRLLVHGAIDPARDFGLVERERR